ncbi:MAG: lipopolysaccharide heptosyltransferase II [Candidatus Aminicenantes bacterium]|jgi:heptosyltransferase-2
MFVAIGSLLTRADEANTIDEMKIVIRAPNWIGDAILSLPALASVQKSFPDAEIWVAAPEWTKEIFLSLDFVEGTIPLSDRNGYKNIRSDAHELKKQSFDIGILFTNSFGSALLFSLAKIPERWGYARDGRHLLLTKRVGISALESPKHHIQYYLSLISGLGLETERPQLDFPLSNDTRVRAEGLFRSLSLDRNKPVIILGPGASYGPAKRWPASFFSRLATELQRKHDAEILIIGSATDHEIAAAIIAPMSKKPIDLTGKTTLPQLAGSISLSDLFITNDSGPMHLANALKVPVVAIFGPTDPRITGPYQSPSKVLKGQVPCWPCSYRECPFEHQCMTQISPERVIEECQDFLT